MSRLLADKGRHSVAGYRLEAVLGRGRNSLVYLAPRRHGGGKVALKVAQGVRPDGVDVARTLQTEFTTLTALAHPHVIRVIEHGVDGETAFMVMEHAAGGPVARSGDVIGPAGALTLMTQAAGGLAWLHRNGWVHRDLKPANLLLRADGSLALCDFGCAAPRGARSAAQAGTMIGTPRYAAPEQTQGEPAHPTADVYALGACLFEILCGKPLYPGETSIELLGQHLMAPVPRLPLQFAAWEPLLDAMLAKDPAARPADGAAVLAQLRPIGRFLQGVPANDTRCAT
jgi:serine/threonine protein kinase